MSNLRKNEIIDSAGAALFTPTNPGDVRVSNTAILSKYQAGITTGVTIKTGAGRLSGVVISGVEVGSVITLYDNTAASGTVLWASGIMAANSIPIALDFKNLPFSTGLTIVISAANSNATIIYE